MSAFIPSLSIATAAPPVDPAAEARSIQFERLKRHAFASDKPDDKAPGLLLGNTAIGGCLAASGLGIPVLWGSGLWRNTDQRLPLKSLLLSCESFAKQQPATYQQTLTLTEGLAKTSIRYPSGEGYDAEVFFSMADDSLLAMRVTQQGGPSHDWLLEVPSGTTPEQPAPGTLTGRSAADAFTPFNWALQSNKTLSRATDNRFSLKLAPGEPLTLTFRLRNGISNKTSGDGMADTFDALLDRHRAAWDDLWRQCAVLAMPDPDLERLWYRSLYWTLSTCGNKSHLPGESMFAVPCWDMHPFTYGAAGWAAQAFTAVGLPAQAKAMLDWHLNGCSVFGQVPEGLKTLIFCGLDGGPAAFSLWLLSV